MDQLRNDVRDAFEGEQRRLGGVRPNLRDDLLESAVAGRRRGSGWPAVAAAVLLAVLLIAALLTARAAQERVQPRAHPAATPKAPATPLPRLTGVSDLTPVITFRDPVKTRQLDAVTWSGDHQGALGISEDPSSGWLATADGSQIMLPGGLVMDRTGKDLRSPADGAKGFPGVWADDDQTICALAGRQSTSAPDQPPATLTLLKAGQPPLPVAQVGVFREQASIYVPACSIRGDRAMVVMSGGQGVGVTEFWTVQLSTGRVLLHERGDYDALVASPDGQLFSVAKHDSNGGWTSAIRRTGDGVLQKTIPGQLMAFSADGKTAVVVDAAGAPYLLRWEDGKVLWTAAPGASYAGSLAEPGGTRVAVALRTGQAGGFPIVDLWVVALDGSAKLVERGVIVDLPY